jgi:hypothetical protein
MAACIAAATCLGGQFVGVLAAFLARIALQRLDFVRAEALARARIGRVVGAVVEIRIKGEFDRVLHQ